MSIYDYQRPVGKIEDVPALRDGLIPLFDMRGKQEMAAFGLRYARHLFTITGFEAESEVAQALEAVQEWVDGKTNYHKARNIAFTRLYSLARENHDMARSRFYKAMAQIACIPHVKAHGLWATDFAITLINTMFPGDMQKVAEERNTQIGLMESIKGPST